MKTKKVAHLWSVLLLLFLMLLPLNGHAETVRSPQDTQKGQIELEKSRISRATEKGLFNVLMAIEGKELAFGVNSLDLIIRDRQGRELTGAEVAVIPWMPEHGHGVWEKPSVTERGRGNYRVENVVLTMSGRWDLKVTVRRGAEEDRAVFSFTLGTGGQAPKKESEKRREEYSRTVEEYKVPNVMLLNQDGEKINLRAFLDSGKPVIINFIYTTCTTICPVLSAGFSNLQRELGKDSRTVQLVSISIDPERDRPEQMKEYLARYHAEEGWDFFTGSREDIALVLKAFDASTADKMSHLPLYFLRGPTSHEWIRIRGLIGTSDLMREFRGIEYK